VPITIQLPTPAGVISPFTVIRYSSDFIGPLPVGSFFRVQVYGTPEPGPSNNSYQADPPTQLPAGNIILYDANATYPTTLSGEIAFQDGAQTHITVELHSPSAVLDSGTITAPWQSTAGEQILPSQIQAQGGGLTDVQATELTQTHASTFTDQLLDNLTLIPLTSGPVPGPINTFLTDTTFGVIVRLATVPDNLVPQTPDGDYWVKTLAVVRLFRSSDLWKRWPIHTSSKLISFASEDVIAAVTALTATQWLLNMSMQVTFLPGVTGEVFLMRFP
jgi:hypothetical protein